MKKVKLYKFLSCTLLVMLVVSCEYQQREMFDTSELPEEISFVNDIQVRFEANKPPCTQCHNGGTPPDLTAENSYLDLTAGGYIDIDNPENSSLYIAIDVGSMKQYATDEDRAFILEWIKQGALNDEE